MPNEIDLSSFNWPDKFISDAGVAKQIVDGITSSHSEYWGLIERMEDHINGKKPKDPIKLRDAGMAWSNNWNYGKASGKIQRVVAENIKSVNDSISLSSISFRRFKEGDEKNPELQFLLSPEIRGIISTIISSVFTSTLDRETRFTSFLNKIEYNSYSFGWCAVTNDINNDWMGNAHHVREIGFKDKTKPNEIRTFSVFDVVDGMELWRLWNKYKKNQSIFKVEEDSDGNKYHIPYTGGWIIEGLEEALFYSYNGKLVNEDKPTVHMDSFEKIVPEFMANPSLMTLNTEKVNIARIYNFEFNGDFTVSYVAYANNWYSSGENGCRAKCCSGKQPANNEAGPKGVRDSFMSPKFLLYQKTFKNITQDDAIVVIQDSGFTVDGNIQDMKGAGKPAVEDSIRYNRKKNNIEDKLLFSGSPFFRQTTAQDGESLRLTPSQGFVLASEGFSLLDNQPQINLQNHVLSLQMDEREYDRDTIHFDPKIGGQLTSRPVKDEVRVKEQEMRRLSGSKSDVKLRGYQRLLFNILKSLTRMIGKNGSEISKDAKAGVEYFEEELLDGLKDFGVKGREELKNVLNSISDLALEPTIGDIQAIKEMLSLSETPYARRRLIRMLFLAYGLPRGELNRLFPVITDDMRSFGDERVAAIENDLFWSTKEVVYSDRDDPVVHLQIHFNKIANVFDQISNISVDPLAGYNYIAYQLEHCIMHLMKMESNPFFNKYYDQFKEVYDRFTKGLNSLKGQIQKLAKKINQQKQQNQQSQGGDENIDPEVKAKIDMDWYKMKAGIELNKIRSDTRAKEKMKDNDFRRRLEQEKHEISMNRMKEEGELKKELQLMEESIKLGSQLAEK